MKVINIEFKTTKLTRQDRYDFETVLIEEYGEENIRYISQQNGGIHFSTSIEAEESNKKRSDEEEKIMNIIDTFLFGLDYSAAILNFQANTTKKSGKIKNQKMLDEENANS